MPTYSCIYCKYSTINKKHFNNHEKTKKHLELISSLNQNLELTQSKKEMLESNHSKTDVICNLCGKQFTSINNMYRHRKHRCTMNNEVLQRKKEKIFKKEIEKLKEELEKKDEIISNIQSAASTSIQTQVNKNHNGNNINNIDNSNNINNQVIINNINNFPLLSYKESSAGHLTNSQYKQILNRRNNCIQEAIKLIHFNENKPENMNIYISNIKNGYILVYNGSDWELKDKELAIEELMDSKEILLEEWLDEYQEKYPELKEKFEHYLNSKDDSKLLEQMKKNIELCLYNNRKLAKNKNNRKKEIEN